MRIRTGYSFRIAVGHLPDVITRLQEMKWKVAPISDTNSTFGFNRWTKAAKKAGLRPVYGVELAVATPTVGEEKSVQDNWTFFAKDNLRSLHDLIALASGQDQELTYRQALAFNGIKIAGERVQLREIVPPKQGLYQDFYISLSPSTPKGLFNEAKKRGFKFIACSDNVYTAQADREFYRITLGKRSNTQTYPQHILSDDEWRVAVKYIAENQKDHDAAIKNRDLALGQCKAEMKRATLLVPEKPKTLRQMCIDGAKRTGTNLKNKIYKERLDRELKLIAEKKFEDYFYVIADMVNWAKQRMIVGPARGSSCGSLVCYLLNITTVDPIPYGLIFERFIDTTRSDLPDIDIDFSDQRRQMVFDYAAKKYGEDHVARLGTVTMFKPTSALNAAGTALQIPKWQVSKVLDGVIERSSGDSRAMNALEDTLNETDAGRQLLKEFPEVTIAGRLEGHPNNSSQHAAGIVITQDPISEYVAVDRRSKSAMVDKKDAEDLNLLKIDALGLTQLSIFERTLQLIGKPDKSGYLETLPLDDKKAFDVLNKGHWAGVFQFTGGALQSLAKQITTETIHDMIHITALARPGPMATGGANSWVKRKTGQEAVTTIHPMLTELTKDTEGVVTFQEQCMEIMRNIGKFSWTDTSAIRKAMSGRLGNEFFEKYRANFIKGAKENGIDNKLAGEIFDQTCTFGSWAFNKCTCGTTKVKLARKLPNGKKEISIKELYKLFKSKNYKPTLLSLFDDGRIKWQRCSSIIFNGKKHCRTYNFSNEESVTCTPDHKFIINGKWRPIGIARIGDKVKIAATQFESKKKHKSRMTAKDFAGKKYKKPQEGFPKAKDHPFWIGGVFHYLNVFREDMKNEPCQDCGKKKHRMEAHHNDFDDGHTRPSDLSWLCPSCHAIRHRLHGGRMNKGERGLATKETTFVGSKYAGKRETYDIEMPEHHNFTLANGLVTHNSHAVAYGLVSYWACYLKAHHPMEFAAATLDAEADPSRQIALLRELKEEGIDYVAVDADHSTDRWVPVTEGRNKRQYLVGPLTAIKGIGPSTVMKILEARKKNEPLSDKLLEKLKEAKTSLDTLYPIADRVKKLHPDLTKINIVSTPTRIIDVQCNMEGPQTGRYGEVEVMIIAVVNKIAPKDENETVNQMKREAAGRQKVLSGPTLALNLFFEDDSDEIFAKIDRWNFERFGRDVIERGRAGKSIYAVKGTVPKFFRMISISAIKYLGDMEDSIKNKEEITTPRRIG